MTELPESSLVVELSGIVYIAYCLVGNERVSVDIPCVGIHQGIGTAWDYAVEELKKMNRRIRICGRI